MIVDVNVLFQVKPLWSALVEEGARLDVVAEVLDYHSLHKMHAGLRPHPTFGLVTFAHFAVEFFDIDLLKMAIAHRVNLNVRSSLFGTALHMACCNFDEETAELLLRNGAHHDVVTYCVLVVPMYFELLALFFFCFLGFTLVYRSLTIFL